MSATRGGSAGWGSGARMGSGGRAGVRGCGWSGDGCKGWYRALDRLLSCKSQLEVELFRRLRTLFEVKVELALYDITSHLLRGGRVRVGWRSTATRGIRGRATGRYVVGLVLIDGWPIARPRVCRQTGRMRRTCVKEVVADLRERFGLKRIVFVGDRGMLSDEEPAGAGVLGLRLSAWGCLGLEFPNRGRGPVG